MTTHVDTVEDFRLFEISGQGVTLTGYLLKQVLVTPSLACRESDGSDCR